MIQDACLERLAQDRPTLLRAAWSLRLLDTPRSGQALGWMFIDPSQNRAHRALNASNVCVDSVSSQICIRDDRALNGADDSLYQGQSVQRVVGLAAGDTCYRSEWTGRSAPFEVRQRRRYDVPDCVEHRLNVTRQKQGVDNVRRAVEQIRWVGAYVDAL